MIYHLISNVCLSGSYHADDVLRHILLLQCSCKHINLDSQKFLQSSCEHSLYFQFSSILLPKHKCTCILAKYSQKAPIYICHSCKRCSSLANFLFESNLQIYIKHSSYVIAMEHRPAMIGIIITGKVKALLMLKSQMANTQSIKLTISAIFIV